MKPKTNNTKPLKKNPKPIPIFKYSYIIIIILGILTYFQTINFAFVEFDDGLLIKDNYQLLSNADNFKQAFLHDVYFTNNKNYRPLLTLSYMLDIQIAGKNPLIFHLTNLILHIISSLLLFQFLKKLKLKPYLILIGTLIFTVHPLLTHTVSWLAARNDQLICLFILTSLIFLDKFFQSKNPLYLSIHLISMFLSILSKETSVLVPILFLSYLWLIKKEKFITTKIIILGIGWLSVFIIWYYLRSLALTEFVQSGGTSAANLIKNLQSLPEFFGKFFLPFNLFVISFYNLFWFIFGSILIVIITIIIFKHKQKNISFILFGLVWFLLFNLLALLIRYDHLDYLLSRSYLPSIGIIIILSQLIPKKWIENFNTKNISIASILIAVLIILNISESRSYSNALSFWTKAVENNPKSWDAYQNYGRVLLVNEKYDEAEKAFNTSLTLNPAEAKAYSNLGFIYFKRKQFPQAETNFKKAIEYDSTNLIASKNLLSVYFEQQKFKETIDLSKRLLVIDKADQTHHLNNLMKANISLQQFETANQYAEEMLKIGFKSPDLAALYLNWSNDLANKNKLDSSIVIGTKAVESGTNNDIAYSNLGSCYFRKNNFQKAIEMWEKSIKSNPNFLNSYYQLYHYYLLKEKNKTKADTYAAEIKKRGGTLPK